MKNKDVVARLEEVQRAPLKQTTVGIQLGLASEGDQHVLLSAPEGGGGDWDGGLSSHDDDACVRLQSAVCIFCVRAQLRVLVFHDGVVAFLPFCSPLLSHPHQQRRGKERFFQACFCKFVQYFLFWQTLSCHIVTVTT